MNIVRVSLLGIPQVKQENSILRFPYRKAEGFFYYLCIQKRITREEAVTIFWSNNDEKTARKNLRDVLYKLRKIFGEDIIRTEGNSLIELNPDFPLEIDTDAINLASIVENYTGEFLSYFYIKNCLEFENWVEKTRVYYQELYISETYKRLCATMEEEDIQVIKKYASILIQKDIYDERMYREIMVIFSEHGHYNSAIKMYYELKEVLYEDLEEDPSPETQEVFGRILKLKESSATAETSQKKYFFGRFEELHQILSYMNDFQDGKGSSIVISGEPGVGKTALVDEAKNLVVNENITYLRYNCYHSEKTFYLKPWYNLLEQIYMITDSLEKNTQGDSSSKLDNKNSDTGAEKDGSHKGNMNLNSVTIMNALKRLGKYRKIVLVLDDIQWMDDASLRLLGSMLIQLGAKKIITLATFREEFETELVRFLAPLHRKSIVKSMNLKRFTKDETGEILAESLPEYNGDTGIIDKIYTKTQGNALFLMETVAVLKERGDITGLTDKATYIIEERLIDLTPAQRELLEAISLFPNHASMSDLKIFFPMVELEIFEILIVLIRKRLITEESVQGDIFYRFYHYEIQEYVYAHQLIGKRQLLHKKIALNYEKEFIAENDSRIYPKLIYHFRQCGDIYKDLTYEISYLNEHYYIYHEIYPHLLENIEYQNENADTVADGELLENLEKKLEENYKSTIEFDTLKMQLYYIMGRYYIYTGNYPKGLEKIERSSLLAKRLENQNLLFKNYKQMVYYGIQVSNMDIMKKHLDFSNEMLENKLISVREEAPLKRLKALYLLETKELTKGEKILLDVICKIEKEEIHSTKMNLAVCYNYLGRCYAGQDRKEEAFTCFLKAVELCDKRCTTNGIGVFYVDLAQVLFTLKKYDEARFYISESNKCFTQTNSLWGKARAEICSILIEGESGNKKKAQEYFALAQKTTKKLNNPNTLAQMEEIGKKYGIKP